MADTCMGAKILPVDNIIFSAVLHGVFLAKLTITFRSIKNKSIQYKVPEDLETRKNIGLFSILPSD